MVASGAGTLTERDRLKSLFAVIMSSFGVGIAFGMGYPLAALTLEARGEPAWIVGIAGAAPNVAILLVMPLLPRYLKGVRPANLMVLGTLIAAAAYSLLYFVTSTWGWIAIRFIMGGALALPWLLGETWINLVADERSRGRVVALYTIAFFAGFAVAPLVLDVTGTTGYLPYLVGMIGAVITIVPIIWARELAPDVELEAASGLWKSMLVTPAPVIGVFLGGLLETTHYALITNVGLAAGLDESRALTLMTAMLLGGLVLQHPLGWLADITSRSALLVGTCVAYVLIALTLPAALSQTAYWPALLNMILTGTALIGLYTLGLAMIGSDARPDQLAGVNAAFIMSYTIGSVTGPVVAGAAMTYAPIWGFVASNAAFGVLVTAAVAVFAIGSRSRTGGMP